MSDRKSDALYISASSFANQHRARFAQLALAHKLPAIYAYREVAATGGLMSYGANIGDVFRLARHLSVSAC